MKGRIVLPKRVTFYWERYRAEKRLNVEPRAVIFECRVGEVCLSGDLMRGSVGGSALLLIDSSGFAKGIR